MKVKGKGVLVQGEFGSSISILQDVISEYTKENWELKQPPQMSVDSGRVYYFLWFTKEGEENGKTQ